MPEMEPSAHPEDANGERQPVDLMRSYGLFIAGAFLILFGVARTFGLLGGQKFIGEPSIELEGTVIATGYVPFVIPVTGGDGPDNAAATALAQGTAVAAVAATPLPGETAQPLPLEPAPMAVPERIMIPAIELDGPVLPAVRTVIRIGAEDYEQWQAPDEFGAGWHTTSALLGQPGNTVLNGHHNVRGQVFRHLDQLKVGDPIFMLGGGWRYEYRVANTLIVREDPNAPRDERLENSRWLLPSDDQRLTLVSCWPYESNTHRIIIVAAFVGAQPEDSAP